MKSFFGNIVWFFLFDWVYSRVVVCHSRRSRTPCTMVTRAACAEVTAWVCWRWDDGGRTGGSLEDLL